MNLVLPTWISISPGASAAWRGYAGSPKPTWTCTCRAISPPLACPAARPEGPPPAPQTATWRLWSRTWIQTPSPNCRNRRGKGILGYIYVVATFLYKLHFIISISNELSDENEYQIDIDCSIQPSSNSKAQENFDNIKGESEYEDSSDEDWDFFNLKSSGKAFQVVLLFLWFWIILLYKRSDGNKLEEKLGPKRHYKPQRNTKDKSVLGVRTKNPIQAWPASISHSIFSSLRTSSPSLLHRTSL